MHFASSFPNFKDSLNLVSSTNNLFFKQSIVDYLLQRHPEFSANDKIKLLEISNPLLIIKHNALNNTNEENCSIKYENKNESFNIDNNNLFGNLDIEKVKNSMKMIIYERLEIQSSVSSIQKWLIRNTNGKDSIEYVT